MEKIKDNGIPAAISNSGGTFVCNHIMYGLLYLIDKEYPHIKGGFIHVPYLPEQVIDKKNMASMSLENIKYGIISAIDAIIEDV